MKFILLAVAMLAVMKIQMCHGQSDTLPERNRGLPNSNNVEVALKSNHDVTKRSAEITRKGKPCDPRAPNGLHRCGYHYVEVSYHRKHENALSCTIDAETGEKEYCCADPCAWYPTWRTWWGEGYWWCRITDKGWGIKWEYCKEGVPYYNLLYGRPPTPEPTVVPENVDKR